MRKSAESEHRDDDWWRATTPDDKRPYQERTEALAADWRQAAASGTSPDDEAAQALAQRHVDWIVDRRADHPRG